VTMLPSRALSQLKRRDSFLFAGGVGGLLASFAAVLAVVLLLGRVA
jgi:hypothetical protein